MKLAGYEKSSVAFADAWPLIREIEFLNVDYCAVLDAGEVEKWPEFFTEDAMYRVTARENAQRNLPVGLIYAQGRGMISDRAMAIARTQMFAPRSMLHLLGNVRVMKVEADGEIEAQTNFLLLQSLVEGPTTIHMSGRFYDRFTRRDGGLLIKERQVVYESSIIPNDLVYPI